jgi:hypothetical protein
MTEARITSLPTPSTSRFSPSGRRDFMYREVAQWRYIRRRIQEEEIAEEGVEARL